MISFFVFKHPSLSVTQRQSVKKTRALFRPIEANNNGQMVPQAESIIRETMQMLLQHATLDEC